MVQIGAISTKKGPQKGVDHARNGQPLPLARWVRDKVEQLLCVEFAKEPAKGHRFARKSLAVRSYKLTDLAPRSITSTCMRGMLADTIAGRAGSVRRSRARASSCLPCSTRAWPRAARRVWCGSRSLQEGRSRSCGSSRHISERCGYPHLETRRAWGHDGSVRHGGGMHHQRLCTRCRCRRQRRTSC